MSVRQRVKEFALLRAVGASPGSVFGIVFLQAIVIGVVGSALGVAAGAGLLAGLAKLLEAMGMPLLEGTGLTGPIIVISLVVGLAVTIVGALLPAREAALTTRSRRCAACQAPGRSRSSGARSSAGCCWQLGWPRSPPPG